MSKEEESRVEKWSMAPIEEQTNLLKRKAELLARIHPELRQEDVTEQIANCNRPSIPDYFVPFVAFEELPLVWGLHKIVRSSDQNQN